MKELTLENLSEDDLQFACNCDEEARKKTALVMDWAISRLQIEESLQFVTSAIHTLNYSYDAYISGIPCDLWLGIDLYMGNLEKAPDRLFVQCDRFEDGLAYLLYRCYRKYGDKREVPNE